MIYHFIGIKGTGMGALALVMHGLGYSVQGSDKIDHFFTEDILVEKGIKILPFDENNIKEGMIIVQGNAFTDDNVEVKKAKELGLEIYSYQDMVGFFTKQFNTITVAGCHGKTTTSAMLSHVLDNTIGTNYLIGDGTGHSDKANKHFVVESCEWKRHFLSYTPTYAIITNIELDHIDYYKDINDMVSAYEEYANKALKMVVACGDDPYTDKIHYEKPVVFYGLDEKNDIVAKNIKYHNDGTDFDVYIKGKLFGSFELPLFGEHMLLNSLAVITVCYYEGIDKKDIDKYLRTFKGAKRRFKETILDDIVVIDDYAHHPTEVSVTIKGAKQKYPEKKIVAILMIHTYSRARKFEQEFADALNLADKAYVTDVYMDRKEDCEPYDANNLIKLLHNGEHISLDEIDKLLEYENAVLIFMSSKEIYVLEDLYEKKLKEIRENNN